VLPRRHTGPRPVRQRLFPRQPPATARQHPRPARWQALLLRAPAPASAPPSAPAPALSSGGTPCVWACGQPVRSRQRYQPLVPPPRMTRCRARHRPAAAGRPARARGRARAPPACYGPCLPGWMPAQSAAPRRWRRCPATRRTWAALLPWRTVVSLLAMTDVRPSAVSDLARQRPSAVVAPLATGAWPLAALGSKRGRHGDDRKDDAARAQRQRQRDRVAFLPRQKDCFVYIGGSRME
jgi:hypothetical protein